ncbi:MAG: ROK family protein [Culicoidibacterales bacterium]
MKTILAFSVSGSYFEYALISWDGNILTKHTVEITKRQSAVDIMSNIKKYAELVIRKTEIEGITISTSGQVDAQKGVIVYADAHISGYTGTEVKKELEDYFNITVEVENNVNCIGLSTAWQSPGKSVKSVFLLTFGNGIGGSYVLNGKLHAGNTFSAGEVGYIKVGNRKLGDYISFSDLLTHVSRRKNIAEESLTIDGVFEMATSGDEICQSEIATLISSISKAIAIVSYVINPEYVLLAGEIQRFKAYLDPKIQEAIQLEMHSFLREGTKLAWLDNLADARLVGAVKHFLLQDEVKNQRRLVTFIEQRRSQLTKREHLLADFVIEFISEVPKLTITEMAARVNVSDATITRFCQKIKVGSYNELRMLANAASVVPNKPQVSNNPLRKMRHAYEATMDRFEETLLLDKLIKIVENIKRASTVLVYGLASQSLLIETCVQMLLNNGIFAVNMSEKQMFSAKSFSDDTIVLVMAQTGYEPDLVKVANTFEVGGRSVYSFCNQENAPLLQASTEYVLIPQKNNLSMHFEVLYLIELVSVILSGEE